MKDITLFSYTKVINNDLSTPMSTMLKLNEPNIFLLESVDHADNIGRYSLLGINPLTKIKGFDNYIEQSIQDNTFIIKGNPLDTLNTLHQSIDHINIGEPPIKNGFFGYFTWDIIGKIETISIQKKEDTIFEFQIPKTLIIFDHVQQSLYVTISSLTDIDPKNEFNTIFDKLHAPLPSNLSTLTSHPKELNWDLVTQNMSKKSYKTAVLKVKEHIKEGDIFQGVISQKFHVKKQKDPIQVYRSLRHLNPSPYMFYFDYGNFQIIGSSPEVLVKKNQKQATVRPIAGTRKRTSKNEDTLINDLKSDKKEIAEHIMLVDLGRNDLGRVCNYNSIKISDLMSIEKYSHVIHMVTNIEATLKENISPIDLFKATFPCGTVSGAPKIRAIEIIEDIEPDPRHIYSGAVGYFNMNGDMDLCIAIRTIIGDNNGYTVQAGAGIVKDSIPENEFNETKSKAQGVLMACFNGEST